MNASSMPGNGVAPPSQPQELRNHPKARPQTVAAWVRACRGCVPSKPAQTQEFVSLYQVEIVPTGPDPQRDPQFLAMHRNSRQRQRRGRPRSKPYPTPVQQPQRSSAMGRGMPIRSDARGQHFQPSPAFVSQSRSLTSTGVINEGSHTPHGQPRTKPHLIFGPQRQPQQSQVVDTNVYLSPYGGHVYQSPDMASRQSQVVDTNVYLSPYGGHFYQSPDTARLDPSAGRHNGVLTTQGSLTQSDMQHREWAEHVHSTMS